jgi:hypothetical protein
VLSYPEAPTPIAAANSNMMSKSTQITKSRLKKNLTAPFFSQVLRIEQAIKKTVQRIANISSGTKGEYMIAAPVATECKPK